MIYFILFYFYFFLNDIIQSNPNEKPRKWQQTRESISTDEDALEGLAELEIEDGVDDGIDERVDVAQPSGELEGRPARLAVALELGANGVQDVAREERDPANQEHTLD